MNKKEAADRIEKLSEELLHQWCESLLKLQIKGTGNPRLDGGIRRIPLTDRIDLYSIDRP